MGDASLRVALRMGSHAEGRRVIVIALLAWSGANAPAQARAPYDGLWSVSLKVEQGSCGEHEIEVFIRNGEISHAGQWGFFTAEGRVGERGRIEVTRRSQGFWLCSSNSFSPSGAVLFLATLDHSSLIDSLSPSFSGELPQLVVRPPCKACLSDHEC